MKLFKARVYFTAPKRDDGKPYVDKADCDIYVTCEDGREVMDLAVEHAKAHKMFKDMTFKSCVYREIKSKKVLREYGLA